MCYICPPVTLHVSVWVEIGFKHFFGCFNPVTLHVSVWVEMNFFGSILKCRCHAPRERVSWNSLQSVDKTEEEVTLHVSVWVEILPSKAVRTSSRSRSTWACELKWLQFLCAEYSLSHAPRERVSWNVQGRTDDKGEVSHAPRERVSWNRDIA